MLEVRNNLGHVHPAEAIDDSLSLSFDMRKRGRLKAQTENGQDIGLFLERGQVLQDGDILQADSGELIQLKAQPEPVCVAEANDWETFAKACYHMGNRHVPLQIGERNMRFQPDYVLEDMLKHIGLSTYHAELAFSPENGAYHGGHHHHE